MYKLYSTPIKLYGEVYLLALFGKRLLAKGI